MKTISRFHRCSIFVAAVFAVAGCVASPLHAFTRGAVLSPTRVVIEGRERAAVVKIINPDDATNRYRISLVNIRMDEHGQRREVAAPTPEETEVLEMIRFSPRRATLEPGEWQTVRIMVRKPGDLAPGEYRAHLKVVPTAPDQMSRDGGGESPEKMSVNLNVLFAVTIPVIIRHGEGSVELVPDKPALELPEGQSAFLETRLNRTGAHSAFFDICAYTPLADGERRKVGELKGVSMYTPNRLLVLNIPIDQGRDSLLPGSPVELEILDREERQPSVSGSWRFLLD